MLLLLRECNVKRPSQMMQHVLLLHVPERFAWCDECPRAIGNWHCSGT